MTQIRKQLSNTTAPVVESNWSKWGVIIGVLAILVSIIIAWWINHEKPTSLNIEKLNTTLLTQQPNVNGLTVNYVYHDSIAVRNLWQTTFVIKNTGETTIYGEGFNEQNIRTGSIPLTMHECDKILSFNISSSNNSAILERNSLKVHQWRPGEFVELVLISEGEKSPILQISDRDIKDSSITYSTYSPEENKKDYKLVDKIPKWMKDALKWSYTIIMSILILGLLFSLPEKMKEENKQGKIITITVWGIMVAFFIVPILWMF